MDAYFKKIDEITESLDQLLEERILLKKNLSASSENMSAVGALNDNMDKINTLDLLLKVNLSLIKTHSPVSGQGDSPVFNELMRKVAETQTKMISFRASEYSNSGVAYENNTFNAQTPFLKPPSSSDNDNSFRPGFDL